jgi:hypothetical protein
LRGAREYGDVLLAVHRVGDGWRINTSADVEIGDIVAGGGKDLTKAQIASLKSGETFHLRRNAREMGDAAWGYGIAMRIPICVSAYDVPALQSPDAEQCRTFAYTIMQQEGAASSELPSSP